MRVKRYLLILLGGRELSEVHAGYGTSLGFLCAGKADNGCRSLGASDWTCWDCLGVLCIKLCAPLPWLVM